ncbi:MAG: hypothetical protein ABI210_01425 [Abditibacteriaceae bacterium]
MIDVHGHYGEYFNAGHALANKFRNADLETVAERTMQAYISIGILSLTESLGWARW